jgi:hypothetical protein
MRREMSVTKELSAYLCRNHIAKELIELALDCEILQDLIKYAYQERTQ